MAEADVLFAMAGEDDQRLRRAALLIDLARAKGATSVEVLGARFVFQLHPHPPAVAHAAGKGASSKPPASSDTLKELLARPPRVFGPVLGVPPGTARPAHRPKQQQQQQAPAVAPTSQRRRRRRKSKRKQARRQSTAAEPTLHECCSPWRRKQQRKQQQRRQEPLPQRPPHTCGRQNARRRRSALRSARCHAARRVRARLRQGTLAIVLKFAGTLLYRLRKSRAQQMEVDPAKAIAQVKARAAAVKAERQQAAREAMAARKAAMQPAAEPMDTLDELVASSRKRALDSCPGCAADASGQLAHTCGWPSSQG